MRESESIVKHQLKKARVNTLHKLVRQANKLEKKRGNVEQLKKKDRKLQRLREQILQAKDVNLDELAKTAVANGPLANRIEEIKTVLCLPLGTERLRRELLLSAAVQDVLERLKRRADGTDNPAEKAERGKAGAKDKKEKKQTAKKKDDSSTQPEKDSEQAVEPTGTDLPKESDSDEPNGNDNDDDGEYSSDDGGIGLGKEIGTDDDFSMGASSDSDGDDDIDCAVPFGSGFASFGSDPSTDKSKVNRRKLKKLLSKDGESADSASKAAQKKKRNRLGQRARQKKWEEQFGTQARHVVENRPANKPRVFKKKTKEGDGTNAASSKAKGSGSRSRPAGVKRKAAPVEDLSELHPSWAAKRMNKEKSSATIQSFEGKRMTFSDSD
ncbi:uncharacterized protein LOC135818166 [Sycon ciliatum]|uniref:uncharacterized protein LOC135818166 n=1 Tax=Sycon ciliatum TaxID=27933 RepID=UPI0031F63BE4